MDHDIKYYFENVDGFTIPKNTKPNNLNNKQIYIKQLLSILEVDVCGCVEIRQQSDMIKISEKTIDN